ncbi:hypothetical protein F0562_003500 [Nyssa sinensis]|uniref:GAG-pre-integrase domain-containing protein n=1 Tax=Nyssa sinensis TaxID=561372 RepID=A0A5J5C0X4_9ASTE|nr:hypothetical protein F0562_003500 [Nyssa sinensis]
MASKDSAAIFSFPNITSFVSVKLDGTNYLNWTTQFIPILRSHDLLGIVDGSEPCPVQFATDDKDKPTSIVTTDYLVWQKKDQFILAWINATLTEKVLSTVYGQTSSRQVWNTLSNRFAPHSRSRISHLKRQLQTLNQSNKTCTDYLFTAKNWSDQLVVVGKPVDEEDLISYVVGGLNSAYHPFITSLNFATQDSSITFDDFQTERLNYEQLLDLQQNSVPPDTNHIAFFTQKSKQHYNHRKPKPYSSNKPSGARNPHFPSPAHTTGKPAPNNSLFSNSKPPCQICGKNNHQALDCYHRMDFSYQGRHPPAQLTAMATHTHVTQEPDQPWFLDSGANNHDLQTNKVLLQGPSEAGLYPVPFQQFQFNKMKAASSFTALLGVTAPVQTWHSRLGHPSEAILQKLTHDSLISVSGVHKLKHSSSSPPPIQPASFPTMLDLPTPTSTQLLEHTVLDSVAPASTGMPHSSPDSLNSLVPSSTDLTSIDVNTSDMNPSSDLPTADLPFSAPSINTTVLAVTTPSRNIVTRSQTNSLKPKQFPDYQLYYSTNHPVNAFSTILHSEPRTYTQAS